MTRQLPTEDSDGRDFIQFRGFQTSVTHDATGVRFACETRNGQTYHVPHPVVDPDDPDPPDDAVARPVAEQMVESNPLIAWGVACETCGDVFDTPKGRDSHKSVHGDDADTDGSGGGGEDA